MYSVSLFGDGGSEEPTAIPSTKAGKTAQGLFGAKKPRSPSPLPRPERFGRC